MNNKAPFISIETTKLKEKLNQLYVSMRSQHHKPSLRHFQDLWDLKELAVLESHQQLMVPAHWLEEIEKLEAFAQKDQRAS